MDEIETLLEKIRINSVILTEIHRKSFYKYKTISKYFDIPIIIISVLSSSFSVGSQSYLKDIFDITDKEDEIDDLELF